MTLRKRHCVPSEYVDRRSALHLAASLIVFAGAQGIAHAQAADAGATAKESGASQIEEIVLTGTRIVREGYQAPTPLTVITSEQMQSTANVNVAQFLNTLPVFAGSSQPQNGQAGVGTGTTGVNVLNLRNLGFVRTLVLLDGRRSVGSLVTGAVDIDSFPEQLIQRVDVVTGGASSVYGSDAVAGVVNFVLDKQFTGAKAEFSAGETTYGDEKNYKIALTAGVPFGEGRGHVLLSGSEVRDDGVLNGVGRRTWNQDGYQDMINPAYLPGNGQPQHLVMNNIGQSSATFGGIVVSGPLRGTAFGPGGVPYQYRFGDLIANPFMRGGDWRSAEIQLTNLAALWPTESRQNAFGRVSFDVTEAINVFAQASWARSSFLGVASNAYLPTTTGPLISADNAFLPASIRAMLTPGQTLQIGTSNLDLGAINSRNDRTVKRYLLGTDGKFAAFGSNWQWEVYVQYGVSDNLVQALHNLNRAKYTQATNAVFGPGGTIVCRSSLASPNNGCVPYNALGIGVNSPLAMSYVQGTSYQDARLEQVVGAASLRGEPFSSWAGPVSVAASFEHRNESITGIADPIGPTAGWLIGNFSNISGRYNVREVALEAVVPLAKDLNWAKNWDLSAAARATDYSTSGYVTTWKVGTTFSPIRDVKFRVTRSRDIRAPNLNELYAQGTVAAITVFDPITNTSPLIRMSTTGNTLLKPEIADTKGIGIVLQPRFAPGFSASIDYWDVLIKGGISTVAGQAVINLCFAGNQAYCNQITRVNNVVTFVSGGGFNQASQEVKGIDFELSYRMALEDLIRGASGQVWLHGNMTRYLKDVTNDGLAPATITNTLGTNPRYWTETTTLGYDRKPFSAALTARAVSGGPYNANGIQCTSACPAATPANPTYNYNHLPGTFYLDTALTYAFHIGNLEAAAFFNIRNILNRDPAEIPNPNQPWLIRTNSAITGPAYDVLGRVYRIGMRFKM